MKKQFVPYEIAKALAELGFKEPCFRYYTKTPFVKDFALYGQYGHACNKKQIPAPLWQQAVDWLREEQNLTIEIYMNHNSGVKNYGYIILKLDKAIIVHEATSKKVYSDYPDAREEAILKAIKLIKEKS